MRIGIIVAMDKEFAQLCQLMDNKRDEHHGSSKFVVGNISNNEVVAMQCGIGKVNAAMGATELIAAYHPELVVSTGVAGGAQPTMEVMDVVVSEACAYHDVYCGNEVAYGQVIGMPERFASPTKWVEKALQLDGESRVYAGLTVTGDWFVDRREKMQDILDHFPDAKAVDMESAAIAHACHAHGVDFLSFRIISDVPLNDHKAAQYYDFWDRLANGSFEVMRRFISLIN